MNESQASREIETLQGAINALKRENAQLRLERDLARADLEVLGPIAAAEQEEQFLRDKACAVEFDMEAFIASLESGKS
jgi:regulator of replication initiation timing